MLTVLSCFVSISLSAQKADLDKYWYYVQTKALPSSPLPAGTHTFMVTSRGSSIANESVPNSSVIDQIAIAGFKRVEGKAHVNIAIDFGDLIISGSKTESRKEETKDKNNVVTSTKYFYKKTISYKMNITGKATNESGAQLINLNANNGEQSWSSSEFSKSSDADDYYRNSYNDIRRELARGLIGGYINTVNSNLNSNYGYPDIKTRDFVWIEAAKKHPEYALQQENWLLLKAFIPTLQGNAAITQAQMDQIKPIIDYFQSVKGKYTSDEKSDKKMRYQAYFTLATIYIMLDDLEAAKKEADGLIANDYDEKDGTKFLKEIEAIKKSFEVNQVNSRHYFVDPEANTPPGK